MAVISVIDDDEDTRMLLSSVLGENWIVHTYEDWDNAVEGFKKSLPDLILLDISLPGKNGDEILKIIRNTNELKHVAVVAVTGYALTNDREKYLKMGFNEYISKPIMDYKVVCNLIERILTRS